MVRNFRHQFIESLHLVVSFLSISYKYNLVSTLLHRGFMISSSYRSLHFEIIKLKQIFRSNEYPKNSVDSCMKMNIR